ncbi:hypothetical protein BVY11_25155 [Pseudomonas amygdali pv. morsprunorum]|nr:hypothetical protein AL050_14750 [Pseudomonas syringae pv. daphniphylli]PPS25406.1 hypothetical protein BVY11_25155 [Pseudomonas amygdali pv. morsprunorum]PPS31022.1 hypothetical protein BVY12_21100 [Pseudomonas amygdali pv. morsprunorum]
MLSILPLADGVILPQAKQESYFFNRIGQEQPLGCVYKTRGDSDRLEAYIKRGLGVSTFGWANQQHLHSPCHQ